MAAGDQRIGELQEQVVDVVALLDAELEDVAEAAGGDKAEAGAAAFDQSVGDQGGAVDHVADVGERKLRRLQQFGEALEGADRWVVRRGQAFVQADFRKFRIQQNEVGEGAADVETDTVAGRGGHAYVHSVGDRPILRRESGGLNRPVPRTAISAGQSPQIVRGVPRRGGYGAASFPAPACTRAPSLRLMSRLDINVVARIIDPWGAA